MELVFTVLPLKTWIFAAGFGGVFTLLKTKYNNFKLGKEYEKNLEEIKRNYFNSIKNDLKTNKKDHLNKILKNFNEEKLVEVIQKIFEEEKFSNLIGEKVKEFIDKMKFESHTSYFNILLLGSSGVGKSTLINSILNLDENSPNAAKVGKGQPVTLGSPKAYISDKVKGLKLWDTQGIDKSGFDIEKLKQSVVNLINANANANDPDNFIHCLWYCVSQHRFEIVERELLIKLMDVYKDETLPIIIVYTQCASQRTGEEMCNEITKICMEKNKKLETILVLAQDMEVGTKKKPIIIPKFGLDELLECSFKKIENAVQSACFHSIRKQIKTNYDINIEKKSQNITGFKNAHISVLNGNQNLTQLKEKMLQMFLVIVKILIFEEDETKTLSENSKSNLLNYLSEYVQTCTNELNEFMREIVIRKSIELANSYFLNQKDTKEKSDEINKGIALNITKLVTDNISLFQTIGLDTGSKEINSKYKEMEEWKKISEDEINSEFNQKIQLFFYKKITEFIVEKFRTILLEIMSDTFESILNKSDDYMNEKTGEQIQKISANIIKQFPKINN